MPKLRKMTCLLLVAAVLLGAAGCTEPELPPQGSTSGTTADGTAGTTTGSTTDTTAETTVEETTDQTTEATTEETTEATTEATVDETTEATTEATTEPSTEPPTDPPTEPPTDPPTEPPTQPDPPDEPAIPNRITVEASGVLVKRGGGGEIDYSNTADGYVMVRYTEATDVRLKAIVKGPTTSYTYNLTPQTWAALPLSDENGDYKITVYRNTAGSKYAAVVSQSVTVTMTDEFAPFLRSNQYVDFDAAPNTCAKAVALTKGLTDPLEKVAAVYDFVVNSLTYDKELAATVKSGYLPVLDSVLEKRKGICFDYAALMAGMLRSQGIPTKLVVGYAGTSYHAWISVWSESTGWVDGVIFFDGTHWQRMDPTFASSGQSSPEIMEYIGNGSNYTAKYFY